MVVSTSRALKRQGRAFTLAWGIAPGFELDDESALKARFNGRFAAIQTLAPE